MVWQLRGWVRLSLFFCLMESVALWDGGGSAGWDPGEWFICWRARKDEDIGDGFGKLCGIWLGWLIIDFGGSGIGVWGAETLR